jgi:phage-related minor tail protein
MRLVNRKLDDLEAEVEQDVMPKLQEFVRLARQVADATADARRRVTRVGTQVTARAEQVHQLLGGTLERVAGVTEQAADFAGQAEEVEDDEEEAEEPTGAVR